MPNDNHNSTHFKHISEKKMWNYSDFKKVSHCRDLHPYTKLKCNIKSTHSIQISFTVKPGIHKFALFVSGKKKKKKRELHSSLDLSSIK